MGRVSNERGFTLPELLVTVGVLLLLTLGSFLLLRQKDPDPLLRDAQRWLDMGRLAQALDRYVKDHGSLPAGIADKDKTIGTESDEVNLCPDLVPHYLKDLPYDPLLGGKLVDNKPCTAKDNPYTSSYTIRKTKDDTVTIGAPVAETEAISFSFKF
jgi:prepilin-type N-terminal cleavage/methylation domain-containing protein